MEEQEAGDAYGHCGPSGVNHFPKCSWIVSITANRCLEVLVSQLPVQS